MKSLSRISNNRALLVLCALGFLGASFGLATSEVKAGDYTFYGRYTVNPTKADTKGTKTTKKTIPLPQNNRQPGMAQGRYSVDFDAAKNNTNASKKTKSYIFDRWGR